MRIAELYASLQGEGLLAGTPSVFVRTSGCNLRCHWCDTPFTSWEPTGQDRSAERVLEDVTALGRRHVVVTGGEPLLFPEVVGLCRSLRREGLHVTVETAGTVLPGGVAADGHGPASIADLVSISPKLSSSAPPEGTPADWRRRHEAARRRDEAILSLVSGGDYQLKFVIDSRDDLAEALAWLADLDRASVGIDRGRVFFMPQGRSTGELSGTTAWLAAECRRTGIRLAPRHHIDWFGHARGT